ncbi:MAG TPA: murein L,D-transpeptidase catalytic domain family protein [Chitinophagaceae bacterium]|nr:murein L,D-transpeptidase catalytic domain family protein [Chitinophagaceae bacterium]
MFNPRILVLIFFLLLSFTWLFSSGFWKRTKSGWTVARFERHELTDPSLKKLQLKAANAKLFVKQKEYNDAICFFVDMSLPSGQKRFFIYNLKKDTLNNSGLVTHGRCNQYWLEGRKYGNTIGCGCSSLGKYKIGNSYNGRFGLAYKLHGLDKTNDKAFERFVVLHSHECVPETEVKDNICQSDGCPTVSPGFLQYLKPLINESKKPVLLWIYE